MCANHLGIVVIGRNEGERLIACLLSANRHSVETVYVDSGSTDGSTTAAARLGISVFGLDQSRPFTAARARNEGLAALRALDPGIRFVQFIDGDCELVEGWIDTALSFLVQRKDVAVVCGRRRERHPEASVYNRLCDIEWDTAPGEALACGGDSMVRVEAFDAVVGFRSQLIAGEEPELCLRLRKRGWTIWRLDVDMTLHDVAMTRFSQYWVRAVRSGYGMAEVAWLYRHSQFVIWRREIARAVFWSGLVPLAIVLGALVSPAALGAILVYPLQICRIVFARNPTEHGSWIYASFMMLIKFAELQGILKFCWRRLRNRPGTLIEYKSSA